MEPTHDMITAGVEALVAATDHGRTQAVADIFRAMVAAAPGDTAITTKERNDVARNLAIDLEQCSLFVDSAPLRRSMTDAAAFLRDLALAPAVPGIPAGVADLDDRLAAAGMYTIGQMLGTTPLTRWQTQAGMDSLGRYEEWLDRRAAEFLRMKAGYELGDRPKDDELYEWVLAHSAAFAEARTNLKAALRGVTAASLAAGPSAESREQRALAILRRMCADERLVLEQRELDTAFWQSALRMADEDISGASINTAPPPCPVPVVEER